jgi:hypothetical protein
MECPRSPLERLVRLVRCDLMLLIPNSEFQMTIRGTKRLSRRVQMIPRARTGRPNRTVTPLVCVGAGRRRSCSLVSSEAGALPSDAGRLL